MYSKVTEEEDRIGKEVVNAAYHVHKKLVEPLCLGVLVAIFIYFIVG